MSDTALIATADETTRHGFSEHLRAWGWRVLHASQPDEVLALAKTHVPDVLLLDLAFAQAKEYHVVRMLKTDPVTCAIPLAAFRSSEPAPRTLRDCDADLPMVPANNWPVLQAMLHQLRAQRQTERPYVLVVDDEPDLVDVLTGLLQQEACGTPDNQRGAR